MQSMLTSHDYKQKGKNGISINFVLGTFDISPHVVEGHAIFQITVHDPKLLDYEQRQSVQCYIVAKELGAGNYTAKAKLTVLLNDVNDNPPEFIQKEFHGNVQEHANIGTTVLLVEATDVDREPGSKIKYTSLTGPGSELFNLDPETGLITVSNSQKLDAEVFPVLTLTVKAADENGIGLTATSTVIINLIDINDQIPSFEKSVYEFILNPDKISFTYPAIIKATDKDISPPNNDVNYEIIDPPSNLYINKKSGEVQVTRTWTNDEVTVLKARAWDNGVPRLYSECEIRIYPPEGQARKMIFIVPGKNLEKETIAQTLRALTGARVSIDRIRPYTGDEPGAAYVSRQDDVER
ncbi:hypothetical protein NQ314_013455 [Rhamnusium bicolor]|uniref:Cadherin domain-containing protein n=1 Tax=Rhamnusium bicolor TaxID=1586634 RepID=A0AAV8X793_9CUCU|nr:hypothetical protein NQ314_013455 [Rhamnusium bicolor]